MRCVYALILLMPMILIRVEAAPIFFESTDAGELLTTATRIPGGVQQIRGAISPLGDIDLFHIAFPAGALVHVSIPIPGAAPHSNWFDTDVTIFNVSGNPVSTHDPTTFDFVANTREIYLAIANWNVFAVDAFGNNIADDRGRILDTTAVLAGWVANTSPLRGGDYTLVFSQSSLAIPEPESVWLVVLFFLSVFFWRSPDFNW